MYRYETHMHTYPVSRCADASIYESLDFYKQKGYDGVFVTNHFPDVFDLSVPHKEKMEYYFSDYEKGVEYGKKIGIKVFCGAELSYLGTDFLVYGPMKEWYVKNINILTMHISDTLKHLMDMGALVIQAHPYREASYIDHIRLFPRCVHGAEVNNAARSDFENKMSGFYAENFKLLKFAGSDNHIAGECEALAGLCFEKPVFDEKDFIKRVKNNEYEIFGEKL